MTARPRRKTSPGLVVRLLSIFGLAWTGRLLDTVRIVPLAVMAAVVLALPVLAHHNYRLNFDYSKAITLEGVVTRFEWVNPHINIHMDVVDEDGNVTRWIMPTAAPGVATRNGLTPETVTAGDKAIVTGWPARDGTNRVRARTIVLEDGRSFPLSPAGMGMGMGN